jgi:hypothetical protein
MEHLVNCHGEWNALFAILSSVPLLGVWARHKLLTRNCEEEQCK